VTPNRGWWVLDLTADVLDMRNIAGTLRRFSSTQNLGDNFIMHSVQAREIILWTGQTIQERGFDQPTFSPFAFHEDITKKCMQTQASKSAPYLRKQIAKTYTACTEFYRYFLLILQVRWNDTVFPGPFDQCRGLSLNGLILRRHSKVKIGT